MKYLISLSLALLSFASLTAQEKVVPLKYGDMDQWITRRIHESGIIGGNTKLLYEVGPTQHTLIWEVLRGQILM